MFSSYFNFVIYASWIALAIATVHRPKILVIGSFECISRCTLTINVDYLFYPFLIEPLKYFRRFRSGRWLYSAITIWSVILSVFLVANQAVKPYFKKATNLQIWHRHHYWRWWKEGGIVACVSTTQGYHITCKICTDGYQSLHRSWYFHSSGVTIIRHLFYWEFISI